MNAQTDMLRKSRKGREDDWFVLVMDELTIRIMSSACKMSEIADENVSRACPGRQPPAPGSLLPPRCLSLALCPPFV